MGVVSPEVGVASVLSPPPSASLSWELFVWAGGGGGGGGGGAVGVCDGDKVGGEWGCEGVCERDMVGRG